MAFEPKTTAAERAKAVAEFEAAADANDYRRMVEIATGDAYVEASVAAANERKARGDGLAHVFLELGAGSAASQVNRAMIRSLAARIEALEARPPAISYEGVWQEGKAYERGQFVTRGGAMWHANCATKAKPGEGDSADWTLAVKSGRDGKDLR